MIVYPLLAAVSVLFVIVGISIYAALTDLRMKRIPNELIILLIILGFALSLIFNAPLRYIIALAIGFVLSYIFWWVGALGGGDAKLLGVHFAILWVFNEYLAEFYVYLLFTFALLLLLKKRSFSVIQGFLKDIKEEIKSGELFIRFIKIFFLVAAFNPVLWPIEVLHWTIFPIIYLVGLFIIEMIERVGVIGEYVIYFVGLLLTSVILRSTSIENIVWMFYAAALLTFLRLPLIRSFPLKDVGFLPFFNPKFSRANLIFKKEYPLGVPITTAFIISVLIMLVRFLVSGVI